MFFMDLVINIFRLIRLPNLLIIVLTQYMVRYLLILPYFSIEGIETAIPFSLFNLLVISTVLTALGGYVLNDFYDIEIDKINKPQKVIVGKLIPGNIVKIAGFAFCLAGIFTGWEVSKSIGAERMVLIHVFSAIALWVYSIKYKKQFLAGNLLIGLLTAMSVLIVLVFEMVALQKVDIEILNVWTRVRLLVLGYAGFAFLITLIREVIKDIEDIKGDRYYDCHSFPVVMGVKATKKVLTGIIILTVMILAYWQFLLIEKGFTQLFFYFIFMQLALCFLVYILYKKGIKRKYWMISQYLKLLMLVGILSMFIV